MQKAKQSVEQLSWKITKEDAWIMVNEGLEYKGANVPLRRYNFITIKRAA